jgi:glycosyltransferase involved in cell wall biosynthesis
VPWSFTYLGVNVEQTKKLILESDLRIDKSNDEIWICYGGSLGNSYDFNSILNAIAYIHEKNVKYRMFFIGDGEKRDFIERIAFENTLNIEITGRVDYKDFLKYLSVCDIGINSFKKGTLVVHSYKFNDYIATNLFILNNIEGETSEMISKYKVGLNFTENNLPEVLYEVCQNWDMYSNYKLNLDLLIKNELDSDTIYHKLAMDILKLVD